MVKDGFVEKVLDRNKLFGNQTPQCFWFEVIWNAYNCAKNDEFTDDISVVLANCGKVRILDGDFKNKKITKIEDILQN
jgi:2-C-methyl-D-erythritol 4-phosphate cytidylyltransferase